LIRYGIQDYYIKSKKYLPITYFHILKSYINGREFRTRINESISINFAIKSGVPRDSVLGPLLYLLYTADLPVNANTTMGTFADDTVILSVNIDPAIATFTLQNHLNQIQEWTNICKIKINEAKSTQVNFSLRREQCPALFLNNI
jgi:histone H2A